MIIRTDSSTPQSIVHSSILGRDMKQNHVTKNQVKKFIFKSPKGVEQRCDQLVQDMKLTTGLGVDLLMQKAMDAIQPLVTVPSIGTPVQFLQNFAPGYVHIATQARKIDEVTGKTIIGNWFDEQIVQGQMELVGTSSPYGDYTNVPFASYNNNFIYQTIVRFEEGIRVGLLAAARAGAINIDMASEDRNSAALALEIVRNTIGFYGYNNGDNFTYGFLNAPGQPAYITVADGASGQTFWSTKTANEIFSDILQMAAGIQASSADVIDVNTTPMTLVVATNAYQYLSQINQYGISVWKMLKDGYPNIRVVSAPELNAAVGGDNVMILFADVVNDSSTDNGKTFDQMVQTQFMTTGVEQHAKYYLEDYLNATAGVWCKRAFAVFRSVGI